jgi:type IV pilus assembly protein PilO
MAMKMDRLPPFVRILIPFIIAMIFIILFAVFIYSPRHKEIKSLSAAVSKLDSEIASSEVKVRKLDILKAENARLKLKLAELQEQLPEEKEVSALLKQISDLGLASGLEILLWKPEARRISPDGLYAEIPVKIHVITDYHNLGTFFSHISKLKRIVNVTGIAMTTPRTKKKQEVGGRTGAKLVATTFAALTPEEIAAYEKSRAEKQNKRRR